MASTRENRLTTPVVLMFFNRPEPTTQVMNAIRQARPDTLILVQDGPRPHHPSDEATSYATRAIAEEIDWECEVHRVYAETNLGVRQRFLTGLDTVFDLVESAIILEDDCLPDPSFFPFCDELLTRFAHDDRVGIISGNNFLHGNSPTPDSYFFSPDVRIWGWATWRRVWREFSAAEKSRTWDDTTVSLAVGRLHSPVRRRAMHHMARIVESLDTWDVSFVLHCLHKGFVNATPSVNLVRNIGFGAQSTHTSFHSFTDDVPTGTLSFPLRHPASVVDTPEAGRIEARAHRRLWVTFPLRHPIDFAGRALRYVWRRFFR